MNPRDRFVPWGRRLPDRWKTRPLKYVVQFNPEVHPEDTEPETVINYVDISSVDSDGRIRKPEEMMFCDAPSRARRVARLGDVIVSTVRTYLTAISRIQQDGLTVSTGFAVLRPGSAVDSRYLGYWMRSPYIVDEIVARSTGVSYPAINPSEIGQLPFPSLNVEEQRAIADFLDRETARIEALIERRRSLLLKLEEKRWATISRTVSRGVRTKAADAAGTSPSKATKDSEIAWIGKIPTHWCTKRLRHISDGITVGVVVNPSSYVSDEGVPFLLGGDVREFRIETASCNRCSAETSDGPLAKSRLNAGDLVVVRVGYPGVAAVVPPELDGANCASMMIVKRNKRFVSQWLAYAFNSQVGRDQVQLVQYGAAQKQYNISHAVDFVFPFPPLTEQQSIADYLDKETADLRNLVSAIEHAIKRSQEYRSAIISAAVTGQIDVRNYKPQGAAVVCP